MGLLDDLTKNLGAAGAPGGQPAAGGGTQAALMQALMGLLASGGLQQLVASFDQHGLGDVIGSWISTGANRPVTPDQLGKALGPEQLGGSHGRRGSTPAPSRSSSRASCRPSWTGSPRTETCPRRARCRTSWAGS